MPAPYTVKNLREVEDSAPKFGFGELQQARFAANELDSERLGVSFHRFLPGKRQGFAHRHVEAEEVYVVLSGSGRMKLDDDIVEVGTLDAIRVSPGVVRQFEGGPDGLDVLGVGPIHKDDTELLPGWWSD